MRFLCLLLTFVFTSSLQAEQYQFSDKIQLTPNSGQHIFHHLDSTGRNNIAVSNNTVGAIWEDNSNGSSQIYVAFKPLTGKSFTVPLRVSNGTAAFSPVISLYSDDSFLIGWEQDGKLWASIISAKQFHKPLQLSAEAGSQLSLVKFDQTMAVAAWSKKNGRFSQIVTAAIKINDQADLLSTSPATPVDPEPPKDSQLSPTMARTPQGVTIVWEDRRRGHTILLYSHSKNGRAFSSFNLLNEVVVKSDDYGRGSGVTRATITGYANNEKLAAAWMDKRNYSTGYDIYAALSAESTVKFAANQMVQDTFGNDKSQWNPSIAGSAAGDIIVAWDDDREDTSDIWVSWKTATGWSDDLQVNPASGKGQQFGPSLAVDKNRNLHLIWIEQLEESGPTKLFYATGIYKPAIN